uniref:BtpA family membrane complex biogenesis protein n=1 Tax=Panagrolaimus sp. JU765 TaxID=591449 RepID=A0AC34REI0_9BILA
MKLLSAIQKSTRPLVFGMIHVPALPGTPLSSKTVAEINKIVEEEARIYSKTKIDGIILENMHDVPYSMKITPEVISTMTKFCSTAKTVFESNKKPGLFGIQILAGGNSEALAVALASDFDFIRAESFVFAHVADEGYMDACAGELLRYRRRIGADKIAVLTDIKKKHSSHAITADLSISEVAHAAEFFLADGVIVTGTATGKPANIAELQEVKKSTKLPVFIGSGLTADNLASFATADGFIVGSHFKKNDDWKSQLDFEKIQNFMEKISTLKK